MAFLPLSNPKWHFFFNALSSVDKNKPNNQNISEKDKFDKDFNFGGNTFSLSNTNLFAYVYQLI
jgi:hypothetical protein